MAWNARGVFGVGVGWGRQAHGQERERQIWHAAVRQYAARRLAGE